MSERLRGGVEGDVDVGLIAREEQLVAVELVGGVGAVQSSTEAELALGRLGRGRIEASRLRCADRAAFHARFAVAGSMETQRGV